MKYIFIIFFITLHSAESRAQFSIGAGISLTGSGGAYIVMNNLDLQHNATTAPLNATFKFTGNTDTYIKGSTVTSFTSIELNKGNNAKLLLLNQVAASGNIFFNGGLLDLHGSIINLGSTGSLLKETSTSRIIETGIAGGYIISNVSTNAPNELNPGNLGAVITSSANPGMLTVIRGHQVQSGSGLGSSILRYYQILAHNDINLDASLSFHYFDPELNGLTENSLGLVKSADQGASWTIQPNTNADASLNFLTKTGYASLGGKYTLTSAAAGALPVRLTNFAASCQSGFIQLNWQTAMEQNSDRFDIERSLSGTDWQKIGFVNSAGNSNSLLQYHYEDYALNAAAAYYRLAQYDLDGKLSRSAVARAGCGFSAPLKVIPNPVKDASTLYWDSRVNGKGNIMLYNSIGQQVQEQAITIINGSNQYKLDMTSLSPGLYFIAMVQNGAALQTAKIIKQ